MAKFKRLSRFLERIGLKRKKKESDHIDLAASSSSRGWRRLWSRRSETGTPRRQSTITNDSRIGRLLRRIRPKRKSVVAKESVDGAVDADDSNFVLPCSSSLETTSVIVAPAQSEDEREDVREDESDFTTTFMIRTKMHTVCQLETISERTEDSDSDTLSITTCTSSFSDLTSVTELIDDADDSSSTVSLTSIEDLEFYTVTHMHCNACSNEGTEYHQSTEWEHLGCYHKHKEIVQDKGAKSNTTDDHIIVFLPVIVVIALAFLLMLKLVLLTW